MGRNQAGGHAHARRGRGTPWGPRGAPPPAPSAPSRRTTAWLRRQAREQEAAAARQAPLLRTRGGARGDGGSPVGGAGWASLSVLRGMFEQGAHGSAGDEDTPDWLVSVLSPLTGSEVAKVSVSELDKVRDLKRKIHAADGTPPQRQSLLIGSRVLQDEELVRETGLEDAGTVHLVRLAQAAPGWCASAECGRAWWNGQPGEFCSRTCRVAGTQALGNGDPGSANEVQLLTPGSGKFLEIAKQFRHQWQPMRTCNTSAPAPNIARIFQIDVRHRRDVYVELPDAFANKPKWQGKEHEVRRFHGTRLNCNFSGTPCADRSMHR